MSEPATIPRPMVRSMFSQEVENMARRRGRQKGYLKPKGPSWIGYWKETVTDPDSGKERWHTFCRAICPVEFTRKRAQAIFDEEVLSKLAQVNQYPQSLASLEQFWQQRYEPNALRALRKNTQIQYRSIWKNHIAPAIGARRLRDIRREHVQQLIWRKDDEKLSPQTIEHIRKVISAIYEYALDLEAYSGANPATRIKMPTPRKVRRNIAYTYDQAQAILLALPSPVREAVLTAALTSMNVAELAGLHWKHVNLTSDFIMVEDEAIPPNRAAVRCNFTAGELGAVKTGNRFRTVPLPKTVTEALQRLKAESRHSGPEEYVFANARGGPMDAHNISNRLFSKAGKALGLKVNWHSFRHSAATWAEIEGMPASDRRALLGHGSSIAITDRYTHENLQRQAAAVERMAEKLCPTEQVQ